jgi:predicted negative regulator of RcsB-dependent stress response
VSSRIDKDALKGPDVFVSTSDKIFNFIEHHFKTVASILGIVLLGAVVYVANNYISSMRETSAASALYPAEAELKRVQGEAQEARAKLLEAQKSGKKGKDAVAKVEALPPEDFAKVYAPAVDQLKAQLKQFAARKTALVTALNLSYFLVQQKQFNEALSVLNMITYEPGSNEDLAGLWLLHKGLVLQENQQLDAAISSYQKVLEATRLTPFHPEALLKLGVVFEAKGDAQKARQSYERVGHEFPKTEASQTALQYLRLMDLKSQNQKPS